MPGVYLEMGQGTERSGEIVKFGGTRLLLGRARRCDIQIQSDVASREHAALRLTGEGWFVEDLDSRNGTWLNEQRVGRSKVNPLDHLRFGPNGPQVRIISLDPPPATAPRSDATQEAILVIPPLENGRIWSMILTLLFVLAGAAFGVLTAEQVWPEGFPYADVLAPITWVAGKVATLDWEFIPSSLPWVVRGLAGIWFGVVGFALAKILKRWWLLLVMAALHAGGWFLANRS